MKLWGGTRHLLGRARTGNPVCVKPKRRHRIRVRKISRGGMTPRMPVASSWVMLSAMGSQEKAWRKGTDRTRVTHEEFQSNPDAWEGLSQRQKRRARQGVLQPSGQVGMRAWTKVAGEGVERFGTEKGQRGGGVGGAWQRWKRDGEREARKTGILHPSGGDRETTARWGTGPQRSQEEGLFPASRAERRFKALSTTGA